MKWYIDSDPFTALRPFPEVAANQFEEHWHEAIFFAIFFHVVLLTAPIVNAKIFGSFYTDLSKSDPKAKLNYDIRIVGIVQSIMSVTFCIPMFLHPMYLENPITGTYPFAAFVTSFAVGYFLWDLVYCCIWYYEIFGLEYLFHAFGALIVFGLTWIPFCQPFLCAFLIYELSTPFVQLHWMFTRSPKGMWSNTLITINGILLISTFFASRIIWGVIATVKSLIMCWPYRNEYPMWLLPVIYILNLGFQFLNFMWFSKMINMAMRLANGGKKPTSKKSD